jgi:hypothetical protein
MPLGCDDSHTHRVVGRWHLPIEIQRVAPKTVHMRGEVGTQVCQYRWIKHQAFLRELMQNPRLCVHVVKDHAVRDQVVVLDPLPLLRAIIRRDDAISAEEQPLDKAIEGLAFVGRRLNGLAQLGIAQILE